MPGRLRRPFLVRRERWIEDLVAAMPGPLGGNVLSILMLPPEERVAMIGRLYERPSRRGLAELLIDLEHDRGLALDVAQALKERVPRPS